MTDLKDFIIRPPDPGFENLQREIETAPPVTASVSEADGTQRTVEPMTGGLRFNSGKTRLSLVATSLTRYAAYGLMYGAIKYEEHNWRKGFKWTEVLESMQRHLDAYRDGEDFDEESGLPHLALAACNLTFLIEFFDTGTGIDDRFRAPTERRKLSFKTPPTRNAA